MAGYIPAFRWTRNAYCSAHAILRLQVYYTLCFATCQAELARLRNPPPCGTRPPSEPAPLRNSPACRPTVRAELRGGHRGLGAARTAISDHYRRDAGVAGRTHDCLLCAIVRDLNGHAANIIERINPAGAVGDACVYGDGAGQARAAIEAIGHIRDACRYYRGIRQA